MSTPEGIVKAAVRVLLKDLQIYFFQAVQFGYGTRTLDFLCCVKGRFVAIEVKRPNVSEMTIKQQLTANEIEKSEGFVLFINDVSQILTLKAYLREIAVGRQPPRYRRCPVTK